MIRTSIISDLIKLKNQLLDESKQYYDWASVNTNPIEEASERATSLAYTKIAKEIRKILNDEY